MQGTTPHIWRQIDAQLIHSRQKDPSQSWQLLTSQVNQAYSTALKPEQLMKRYERISTKLPDEDVQTLLELYKINGYNFQTAAQQTNCTLNQAKRQIIQVLVNNIMRVCMIVRKRDISTLKTNFITDNKIKRLVMIMLKEGGMVREVSQQFAKLWNFISTFHTKDVFQSVASQDYKTIYRELIILCEKFQLNDPPQLEKGFQSSILRSHSHKIPHKIEQGLSPHNANLLQSFRKRGSKQTIDLVSQDEDEKEERSRPKVENEQHSQFIIHLKPSQAMQIENTLREKSIHSHQRPNEESLVEVSEPMQEQFPQVSTATVLSQLSQTYEQVQKVEMLLKQNPNSPLLKDQLSNQVFRLAMLRKMMSPQ